MSLWADGFWADGFWADGFWSELVAGLDVRNYFLARRASVACDYTFADAIVDPGESYKVELDLFPMCASYWRANERYPAIGEYLRPRLANGFSYEVTTAGSSAQREPAWPRTIGGTVQNGSVVFTCRAAGTNGVMEITSPTAISDPTGLTIGSVSVSESTKILATYSAGTLGQDYDAVFTFTLNGATRVARQTVKVRRR
jgi:hypothetical protein